MNRFVCSGFAFALLVALAAWPAAAQQTSRVSGMIQGVDGATIVVKTRQGDEATVKLTDNAAVFGVVPATLADLTPGAFIGVGAMPQPDGTQKAIQVTVFAKVQRGTGEGHRAWDRPNTTMTNATVDTTVGSVDGQVLTVKYKDGEKKIIVTPEAVIRRYVEGERSELKPGVIVAIFGATRRPDGTFEAARVNVGRDGVVP